MVVLVVRLALEVVMVMVVLMSDDCLHVFRCIWANGW